MTENKAPWLEFWAIFFCLVPYLKLLPIPSDTQPYGALFAALALLMRNKTTKWNVPIAIIGLSAMYLIVFGVVSHGTLLDAARSSLGVLSFTIVLLFGMNLTIPTFPRVYVGVQILWFIVSVYHGFSLITHFPYIVVYLMNRVGTGGGRGITSLAVEPSFLGMVMFLFLVFNELFAKRGWISRKELVLFRYLNIFQMLFSLSVIPWLLIPVFGVSLFILRTRSILRTISVILGIGVVFYLFATHVDSLLPKTRVTLLIANTARDPISLMLDFSFIDRFSSLYLSNLSPILLPIPGIIGYGPGSFLPSNVIPIIDSMPYSDMRTAMLSSGISLNGRIMSGIGSLVFEAGWVGILAAVAIEVLVIRAGKFLNAQGIIFMLFTLNAILFNAMPLANSLLPFLLGVAISQTIEPVRSAATSDLQHHKPLENS